MDIVLRAVLAGVVAGLAVAVPLGAIGVLILQEGLARGWRAAAGAATGVALVDLGYAVLATAAGTAVTGAVEGRAHAVRLLGAVVLVVVAARGLLSLRRPADGGPAVPGAGNAPVPARAGGAGTGAPGTATAARVGPVLRRFVAMTAVNPLTAVYFVGLAAGLGSTVAGVRAGTAFVLGVFAGSWAWQLLLAVIGSLAGARMPPWTRTATGVIGYLVVIGYAVRLGTG